MVSKRAWETYPQTYRAREMEILATWIRAGESGSVVGLAGAGKSNLLGFLCHRPQVMAGRYLPADLKLAPVLVDLNNLPGDDLATFYRVILRSLYEARLQMTAVGESLPDTVQELYRKVEGQTDPFVSQSALREVLLAFRAQDVRLVLVLDPFDRFCQTATTQVLDNLRGLRDSFKATLSYIVGLRRELVYLRDPLVLGELYEILDTHVCWLGPMQKEDARWVISQVEEGMGQSFADKHRQGVEWLIDLTGGYPALLRAASLWLATASPAPDVTVWERQLLAQPSIQNRLSDLWQGLTGEEQAALANLQRILAVKSDQERVKGLKQIEEKHQHALARLGAKRVLIQTDTGRQLFSPLFAASVAAVKGVSDGEIWRDPQTGRFFRGEKELTSLTEQDCRLLRHFLDHPVKRYTTRDLIETVWAESHPDGVTNQAVGQAIYHLRQRIEPNPARPCYLITEGKSGYCFFPEGAPQG